MNDKSRGVKKKGSGKEPARGLDRRQVIFLIAFVVLLGGGFSLLALRPVDRHLVVPFTAAVAHVSGWLLDLLGQHVTMQGTQIHGARFAVDVKNGCNGLETVIVFGSAVLAFPSPWRSRLIGTVLGFVAIQLVNLIRVVALYLTGAYFPRLFDQSHTVVWQSIVVAFGVLLWLFWASRFATPKPAAPS